MARPELLARIGDPKLRGATSKIFEVADAFAARRKAIDGDGRLTDVGRLAAITEALEHDAAPALRIARQPLHDARAALDARRSKIALPSVDRNDTVGAIDMIFRRAFVRGLPEIERTKLLFSAEADPRLLDAVISDAPELSGIPRDRHAEILNRRLRQLHGKELDEIERDEAALAEAEAAAAVAMNDMKAAFGPGSDGRRFNQIMDRKLTPWLVGEGSAISVVILNPDGTADYRPASEAEIKIGRRFASVAEYQAQSAA